MKRVDRVAEFEAALASAQREATGAFGDPRVLVEIHARNRGVGAAIITGYKKALSLGAKAVSGGRFYLYALAAAGQPGVERALGLLEAEIVRDMKLMGKTSVAQLTRDNLRRR